jgi:hypothetical protein
MSDASVAAALRSHSQLVVVEAPAGCGKTFQGADYAREAAGYIGDGRVLIVTHTHAACDVFAKRTSCAQRHVDIRTIDSLICQLTAAYHLALDLPADTSAWARSQEDGYDQLALRAARLLRSSPMIGHALAKRYPAVICDEHQDASADQHAIAMACYEGGAKLRIFGDPMQRIYGSNDSVAREADCRRWQDLKEKADTCENLDYPHRWSNGSALLGEWILAARDTLSSGKQLNLFGNLPPSLSVIVAENKSQRYGGYMLDRTHAKPIYSLVEKSSSLLVMSPHNATVKSLRACFGRRIPIWEGHVRDSLTELIASFDSHSGNAVHITKGVIDFLNRVATGFSPSAFGKTLLTEVLNGCIGKRTKKPATLQDLGRIIIREPNHKGVAKMLQKLDELIVGDAAFRTIKIDYRREFCDAIRLGAFDDPCAGFHEMLRRRTHARLTPPTKAISTIHKAKGLECDHALLIPCDAQHYNDTDAARCRLYVALSRAMHSLSIVVSRTNPSPLIVL